MPRSISRKKCKNPYQFIDKIKCVSDEWPCFDKNTPLVII